MTNQQLINEGYVDGKKSFDYVVKEIFNGFDFERVYKAMKALDWVWYFGVDSNGRERKGVPDVETIRSRAYEMLKEVYERGVNSSSSTGGFSAGMDDGELYLTFNIEENSVTAITSSPIQSETEVSEG